MVELPCSSSGDVIFDAGGAFSAAHLDGSAITVTSRWLQAAKKKWMASCWPDLRYRVVTTLMVSGQTLMAAGALMPSSRSGAARPVSTDLEKSEMPCPAHWSMPDMRHRPWLSTGMAAPASVVVNRKPKGKQVLLFLLRFQCSGVFHPGTTVWDPNQ